jgi:uncharacterized protein YceH (UPF0502 family)
MKETLLERCQREAREMHAETTELDVNGNWVDVDNLNDIIAHTLKQAAEAIKELEAQVAELKAK